MKSSYAYLTFLINQGKTVLIKLGMQLLGRLAAYVQGRTVSVNKGAL